MRGSSADDDMPYQKLLQRRFIMSCQSADAMGKLARYESTLDRVMVRNRCRS